MADEKPGVDGFLAVIEAKIAALKTLADSYRAALSLGALGPTAGSELPSLGASAGMPATPTELPKGALLGKSLPAAIKLYLSAAKGKATVREITNALREGGVESTSPNFENIVTGSLHRLRRTGEVLRFKDGWASSEFYPQHLRSRIEEKTTSKKMPKKSRKARATTPKSTKPTTKATTATKLEGDKTATIYDVLGDVGHSPQELHAYLEALKTPAGMNYVYAVLHRLHKQGKAEKRTDGKWYRAIRAASAA